MAADGRLPNGAVAHVCPVPDTWHADAWRASLGQLSVAERQRLARMAHPAARRHFVAARLLLRRGLCALAPLEPAAWALAPGPTGRLQLAGAQASWGLFVSLSHCPGWVACIIAGAPAVGIDLEWPGRRLRAPGRLVGRLHPREQAAYAALPPSERASWLVRLWTRKEAFGKALGRGLTLPLSATCFAAEEEGEVDLGGAGERAGDWRFAQSALDAGPHLTAALGDAAAPRASWLRLHAHDVAQVLP